MFFFFILKAPKRGETKTRAKHLFGGDPELVASQGGNFGGERYFSPRFVGNFFRFLKQLGVSFLWWGRAKNFGTRVAGGSFPHFTQKNLSLIARF